MELPPPALERAAPGRSRPAREAASSGCASRSASTTTSASSTAASAATRCSGRLIRRRPRLRPAAPALALGGARLGGRRAADRERAGGADPAPHRRPLGGAARRRRGARCATCPPPTLIAGRAPAELEAAGPLAETLDRARRGSPARSPPAAALPASPQADRRLLAVPEIGPWTVQCLGLFGRGEPDSLPAGDLDLPQAGRPPGAARPPRDGRGGRGVLRAVRAVPGPCGRLDQPFVRRRRISLKQSGNPSITRVMPQHPAQRRGWPEEQVTEFIDQLSSAGEDYRRLVERLPAIIYTAEMGERGRWRYVSPQVEEILGYTPGGVDRRPRPLGRAPAPRRSRAGARAGEPQDARRPQPAAGRLPDADPRRRGRLDPRRGGARGRRSRRPGLARRPLRHHRAQERRAGAAAGRRPAGDRRPARRDARCRTATPRP